MTMDCVYLPNPFQFEASFTVVVNLDVKVRLTVAMSLPVTMACTSMSICVCPDDFHLCHIITINNKSNVSNFISANFLIVILILCPYQVKR